MSKPDPNSSPLSLGTFLLLRDLIRDRLGVSYEEDKRSLLAHKLSDRITALGLNSYLDYFYQLKYGPNAEEEWPRLTDVLSVQETYFWREIDQVKAFVDELVPQFLKAGRGPIRVWSAACATGEEPLTLAMALNEAGWFDRAEIEINATDVSPAALEKADHGVYRSRAFRALPEALKKKYFAPHEGGWRIDPSLHRRVRFARANLLEPSQTAPFDDSRVIFCRNVFIYFSPAAVARVVSRFAARMPSPGYFFVGVSESLLRATKEFELRQMGEAFVYVKK